VSSDGEFDQMTGGQYTVFRVLSGLLLAATFAGAPMPYGALGLIAAALFTVGFFHRVAAAALALVLGASAVGAPSEGRLLALLVLALHAALPPKPYGSLAMRGDADPGSTWRFPALARVPLWLCLGLLAARVHWTLGVLPLLALMPRLRPFAWLALLAVGVARIFVSGPDDVPGWWLAVLLTFEADFVRPSASTGDIIFYDGACGLCHRFVRFVLSEDRDGAFKFAPLQSETFTSAVPEEVRKTLPDSVIVLTAEGQVLSRSAAVTHVLLRLGGLWGAGGRVAPYLPQKLLDATYDRIAGVRYRLFKKPDDACPLMPKELRARFLY
jgi:predicted DCC family thiol-disulfide oxidoreductase YuxK